MSEPRSSSPGDTATIREGLATPPRPCLDCTHDHCECEERKVKGSAALDRLETELAEARFQRDQWEEAAKSTAKESVWWQRAEAAEAERDRLREALEQIRDQQGTVGALTRCRMVARAALVEGQTP